MFTMCSILVHSYMFTICSVLTDLYIQYMFCFIHIINICSVLVDFNIECMLYIQCNGKKREKCKVYASILLR